MRNGGINVPQDMPVGKATGLLQNEQNKG